PAAPPYDIAQVCHHNGIVGFVALVARKVGNLGKRPNGNCTQNWGYGAQHYGAQQIRTCECCRPREKCAAEQPHSNSTFWAAGCSAGTLEHSCLDFDLDPID